MLESELFGYEEGAFTGARRGGHRGLFEAAHTGTLFLDEIGDMPLQLQTRLLRVIQEREVVRLGSTVPNPVDIRIVAATHQPIEDLIAAGRFRPDLYYRISTLRLYVPPLRERREDISALARASLSKAMQSIGLGWDVDSTLAFLLPYLMAYDWPGNVRELENIVQRMAVYLSQFPAIERVGLDGLRRECPELFKRAHVFRDDPIALRQRVEEAIKECKGNRQAAAQVLGVSRNTLWRWLKKFETPGQPEASSLD